MGDSLRFNMYMYTLYLRGKDTILVILCMSLPIIITFTGQSFNSLIFHDNIKCITANEQTIIYIGANNICHVTIIHSPQKNLASTESFLIYAKGAVSHDWSNSMSTWLHCNYLIHSTHKEITI